MSSPADDSLETREVRAEAEAAGERLDRWMARVWPDLSRSRCKALVEAGRLILDGEVLRDPSAKLREDGLYTLSLPRPVAATPKPEAIALEVLFEDDQLIVINKPAGMAAHPAAGNWTGTLVHALLHHCAGGLSGIGGVERPGIVHRLDKDTSGVMVAAKTDAAHQALSKQFAKHSVERAYLAFTRGAPKPRFGVIEARLARSSQNRKKMAIVRDSQSTAGKHAVTHYETVKTYGQVEGAPVGTPIAALVRCVLETGRTHQIRVHLTHIGAPLLGDPVYGRGRSKLLTRTADGAAFRDFRRQALHAAVLGFDHPTTGARVRFETELPKDMQRLEGFLERL